MRLIRQLFDILWNVVVVYVRNRFFVIEISLHTSDLYNISLLVFNISIFININKLYAIAMFEKYIYMYVHITHTFVCNIYILYL